MLSSINYYARIVSINCALFPAIFLGAQPHGSMTDVNAKHEIALFDHLSTDQANIPESEAHYSAAYMCDIAGYSYFSTNTLENAMQGANVILFANGFDSSSFTENDYKYLIEWVKNGGVIITPAIVSHSKVTRPYLSTLYGISENFSNDASKSRKLINWNTSDESMPELVYFDEPEEIATSIGEINAYTYPVPDGSGAEIMATFSDNMPAVLRNNLGNGKVYMAGIKWRDVILRNQLNKDLSSSRCYNNGFEPSADAWPLWLRSIVASNKEVSAWKFTVPGGYTQLLIPTHDCDSQTAYDEMHFMAEYEESIGCQGHYFLTTHYFRDKDYHDHSYLSAFYNDQTVPKAKKLLEGGHTVGSHSVCHFPDFNKCDNMDIVTREEYAQRATCVDGKSTGASTWAEIVLSKKIIEGDLNNNVRSFRSGHLCYNADIPEALEIGEYSFASTFTAGDLLSEFPFFVRTKNNWEGHVTNILQMPLHISDVYKNLAINDSTWDSHPCVDQWESAMKRLHSNYASAILLIHPNREWKMTLEKRLIERLDLETVGFYNFERYGDFWKARLEAPCLLSYDDESNEVTITSDTRKVLDNKMTFAIEALRKPESVIIRDNDGSTKLICSLQTLSDGRYLAIPDLINGIKDPTWDSVSIEKSPLNYSDNLLSSSLSGELSIVSVDGRLISGVTHLEQGESIPLHFLKPGFYIAELRGFPSLKIIVK